MFLGNHGKSWAHLWASWQCSSQFMTVSVKRPELSSVSLITFLSVLGGYWKFLGSVLGANNCMFFHTPQCFAAHFCSALLQRTLGAHFYSALWQRTLEAHICNAFLESRLERKLKRSAHFNYTFETHIYSTSFAAHHLQIAFVAHFVVHIRGALLRRTFPAHI